MFARYRARLVALVAGLVLATLMGGAQARDGFAPDRLAAPPADSRPTMLWYWNGRVTPGLVDRQLAEMRAKGIREAVLFPFDTPALQPAVFTEGWFDIVEHVLREARRTGMKIWLFNDSFFPSGRGAGLVVNGGRVGDRVYEPHPELRIKGLTRIGRTVSGPAAVRPHPHPRGPVAHGG